MTDSDFSISAEGELKGKIQRTFHAYDAWQLRKEFFESGKEKYIKDLASAYSWEISSSEFQNIESVNETVTEKHEIKMKDYAQVAGDHMYFNPVLFSQLKENPLKSEKREYPVDFGNPQETLFVTRITMPEGWDVEELPRPKIFLLPGNGAKSVYSVTQNGNVLLVTRQVAINKSVFMTDEYSGLRDFYDRIVEKHAEQVVLKKK